MTDRTEEILDLVKARDHHYSQYKKLNRALKELTLDRNEESSPLEEEVWHVIPTGLNDRQAIVPAIKGVVGWYVAPPGASDQDIDDIHVSSSHVYPVEIIAEVPNTTKGNK